MALDVCCNCLGSDRNSLWHGQVERAEGNHAVLCTWAPWGWSKRNRQSHKVQANHEREGGKAMWLHTGHRCKQWPTVESHRCTRRGTPTSQTCTHKHADQIWSMTAKISSQAQITNICSLFLRQRPCRSLPQLARLDLVFLKLHKDLYH